MDENTTLELIKERFEALPESIQEIILSSHYQEDLIEISKKYNLNVEQMGILERETTMVMMGLINPNNFEMELTKELGFEKEKGHLIVNDINEKIFLKIRDLLKLMNTPLGAEPSLEPGPEIPASSNQPNLATPELNPPASVKGFGETKPAPSMLAQKLSGSFQIPSTKTEYSVPNVTKDEEKPVPQKPTVDPYREIPE
ncbi:hypothetical protein A2933_00710 [Candidatus Nomurabacteria bacterium RIFCSPLOWO2_01_FULL_46_18]|uniref:Uncharacterized protein n=1 Tax=Candidatus Nomurabacteria bacterium RIFCSPLOWO2_01_FULL_46_18 TaxID=1801783 RepID=A0A1F6XF52_9BACT|nr:MAG: hypothetical protein A2933_00710 [Candidatus Nomurabacteria bacterium RIFCSPLOWO2_01_FULL_46_18]